MIKLIKAKIPAPMTRSLRILLKRMIIPSGCPASPPGLNPLRTSGTSISPKIFDFC